ncbi:hypothetical protein [Micromonospora sp. NPDC023644]|uniref:hypothetical protein n=1 Tax=Micromonospora sp. NPDC023644 TaxID=3154321 RepID=UPI0033E3F900
MVLPGATWGEKTMGLPVSSTQSRSAGSTTMLCTDTNAWASSSADGLFNRWSGNGTSAPSRSSTTVAGTSSPHLGKLTKTRPVCETLTPVGIGPVKVCTTSSSPAGSSLTGPVIATPRARRP